VVRARYIYAMHCTRWRITSLGLSTRLSLINLCESQRAVLRHMTLFPESWKYQLPAASRVCRDSTKVFQTVPLHTDYIQPIAFTPSVADICGNLGTTVTNQNFIHEEIKSKGDFRLSLRRVWSWETYSLLEVDRHFRGTYCLYHLDVTSVFFKLMAD
jgi:hypothetical protein